MFESKNFNYYKKSRLSSIPKKDVIVHSNSKEKFKLNRRISIWKLNILQSIWLPWTVEGKKVHWEWEFSLKNRATLKWRTVKLLKDRRWIRFGYKTMLKGHSYLKERHQLTQMTSLIPIKILKENVQTTIKKT